MTDASDLTEKDSNNSEDEYNLKLINISNLVDYLPIGILIGDYNGKAYYVNQTAVDLLGYESKSELIKLPADSHFDKKSDMDIFLSRARELKLNNDIYKLKRKNGSMFWSSISVDLFIEKEKTLLLSVFKDLTEEKEIQDNLEISENKFRAIFSQAAIGICNLSNDGTLIEANEKFCQILGYSIDELVGLSILDILVQESQKESSGDTLKTIKEIVESELLEERVIHKNNHLLDIYVSSSIIRDSQNKPIMTILTIQDVTEKKKSELIMERLQLEKNLLNIQLLKKQNADSIGTLASGVAHEINNPLNGIINFGQLILDSDTSDDNALNCAAQIIEESQRATRVIKALLDYSRQDIYVKSYFSLKDMVEDAVLRIKDLLKQDQINVSLSFHKNLPKIKCSSQKIQQVILNLLSNSRDSLNIKYPEHDENKTILIEVTEVVPNIKRRVKIKIEDHGNGIDDDIKHRIFNPFFTTKRDEKGTGLGLTTCQEIIERHGGRLYFETEKGKFTKFYIELPSDEEQDDNYSFEGY